MYSFIDGRSIFWGQSALILIDSHILPLVLALFPFSFFLASYKYLRLCIIHGERIHMMNKDSVTARDTLLSQISESFWIDSGTTTLNLPRSAQAPRRTACWTTFPTAVGRWLHFIFSASSHTKSTVISIRTPYVFRDYNFVGFSVCV